MTVLRREKIVEEIKQDRLHINPFDEELVEPASYDLALGSRVLSAGKGMVTFEDGEDFVLESNAWAAVSSKEVITLPNDVCATYGIRSAMTRRGLMHFGGPQIDPGYHGRLFLSLYNPTLEPIILRVGRPIFSLIFHRLDGPVGIPYAGSFQHQTDFPSEDVERMMRLRSKNLSNVIDTVETLDESVANLAGNMQSLTGDVREIKEAMNQFGPALQTFQRWGRWTIRGAVFVAVTVAAAAITFLVERFLGA